VQRKTWNSNFKDDMDRKVLSPGLFVLTFQHASNFVLFLSCPSSHRGIGGVQLTLELMVGERSHHVFFLFLYFFFEA